jgi:hypothetical protein
MTEDENRLLTKLSTEVLHILAQHFIRSSATPPKQMFKQKHVAPCPIPTRTIRGLSRRAFEEPQNLDPGAANVSNAMAIARIYSR